MSATRRPSKSPGIGAISMLAVVVVLVPGILVYVLLRAVGLEIGPAGVLGLFVMIVGMAVYPVLLRRTGWVDPPHPPPAAPSTPPRDDEQGPA